LEKLVEFAGGIRLKAETFDQLFLRFNASSQKLLPIFHIMFSFFAIAGDISPDTAG
jgi:hypothetical protein